MPILVSVNSSDTLARYLPLPQPFCDRERYLKMVGSCNGLLCLNSSHLVDSNPMYYVLNVNPSTGNVLTKISLSTAPSSKTCSGFAYDGVNDDYKLLVVEYFEERRYSIIFRYRKVIVYSMKSNSWRCIETTCLGDSDTSDDYYMCIPYIRATCVLINNYLMHWLLRSPAGNRSLVCFNLVNEQWTADVSLPNFDDFKRGFDCAVNLGILNGCLCLSVHNHIDKFNVWIMKDYRAQGSWTMFSIAVPSHCRYCSIFAYEHVAIKEILLTKSRPNKLGIQTYVWYNVRDKTAKEIQLSGAPDRLEDDSLCIGSLATGFGNCQSQTCKVSNERMKIDNQVKVLQANASNNLISCAY